MKRLLILAFALGPALSGCQGKPDAGDVKPTALVTLATVTDGPVGDTITAYGEVTYAPQGERVLVAPFESRVVQVLAPAGHPVRAGEAVAVLTPTPAAQVDIAKATQDAIATQAAYLRAQRLRATGLVSDAEVEAARAAAVVAAKSRQLLGGRLDALTLRAPIAGVVESITGAPGDQVAAGASVAKIGSLTTARARLGVEPGAASRIAVGGTVHLTALADNGPGLDARIVAVDPHADTQTRLASVIADVPGGAIVPGVPVRGTISLAGGHDALAVPRAALLYEGEQTFVFVAAGGVAHRRNVKIGSDVGDRVEISSGVKAGEQVVIDGAAALDDGMAVRLK